MVGKQRNGAILRIGNNKLNKRKAKASPHQGRTTKSKAQQMDEHHEKVLDMLNAAMPILHSLNYHWNDSARAWQKR